MTLNYRQLSIIIPGTGIQQTVRRSFLSCIYFSLIWQLYACHDGLPENTEFLLFITDHGSNSQFRAEYERDSDILLSMSGHGKLNSPKRLSLDERLERELGIKVNFAILFLPGPILFGVRFHL